MTIFDDREKAAERKRPHHQPHPVPEDHIRRQQLAMLGARACAQILVDISAPAGRV